MLAKLTSKNQITLPKAVRDALGLTKGTNVTIQADGQDAQKAVEKLVALMDELD